MSPIEAMARALCKARGWNPDTCLSGGGMMGGEGYSQSYCHVRMWENCIPDARAALQALADNITPEMWEAGERASSLSASNRTATCIHAALTTALQDTTPADGGEG